MWKPLRTLGKWLAGDIPKPPTPARRGKSLNLGATYDAAQTGSQNRNHWAAADEYGPMTATGIDTRRQLRKRARLERDNDPHMDGLTKTLAYDLLGTGPRLQLTTTPELAPAAMQVTKEFSKWFRASNMLEKFRLLIEPRPTDGETFGRLIQNPLIEHPVKLDLQVLESEQIHTPFYSPTSNETDGVEFDQYGNATFYHVLKEHPGEGLFGFVTSDFTRVPASEMVHWCRMRRPGQARGVSEFASALPIGAQNRRYSNAVLSAAETAANIAGVLKTNVSADTGDTPTLETMEEIDTPRNSLLTVPGEWEVSQLKAEQPTGTYVEFHNSNLNKIARPVLAPFNVISGNSSGYNYSSGRLDHLPYHQTVWIERERFRNLVLDKVFPAWAKEAAVEGLIPAELGPIEALDRNWHWDGFPSIDPFKDANAVEKRLSLNLTTLMEECAAEGKDWREVLDQRAVEADYAESLGLSTVVAETKVALGPDGPDGESTLVPLVNADDEEDNGAATKKVAADPKAGVQDTALNGAQITSLVLICDKLPTKQYPAEGAEAMIQAAFPLMDRKLIATFVRSLSSHTPPPPPEAPPSNNAAQRNSGQAAQSALTNGVSLDDVDFHSERNGVGHV